MTFEFFNTSRLAFGSKLTAAFKQLNNNLYYALQNMQSVLSALEYFDQYKNRNFRAPVPTRGQMVARVNELFAFIDEVVAIQDLSANEGIFSARVTFFTKAFNRITCASGSTTTKEGYAFVVPSPSNSRIERTIRFSEKNEKVGSEILLFGYRIDNDGNIFLKGNLSTTLRLFPQDATQYKSLTKGGSITFPYTAPTFECVCVVGADNDSTIKVNDKVVIGGKGSGQYFNRNYAILYLKKGDVVSGSINYGFKINYNY